MTIIICRDHAVEVPGDVDSLRLIFLRDQHDLCPTNARLHADALTS